jgi:OHS family lactose permease-like MFS transporter
VCGVRPKFWEGGWIEMEKSKRTFRGSYPAYALTYFFFYWSLGVFTSVLSMYLTGIGKSKAEMSFIMSASSLFGVVLIPIVGYINDKLRKPRLICTVMMACVAVFGILFALVRETMLLFLLNGCIMGFISSLSPVSERMATSTKYRYGTIRIWGTFGYAAAVQVACAMMEFTSPQLIFVSVSVSAVLAIVGFLGTDDISFTDTEAAKAAAGKQFSFLCAPMYILFVIIGFVFSGCSNLNMTYSPILLQELGMPTGAVGTVLFFSTIVELPVILFSYKFMDRFSGRTLMLLAFAIMVAQFLLYATAPNAFVAVVTMLVYRFYAVRDDLIEDCARRCAGAFRFHGTGRYQRYGRDECHFDAEPWRYSGGKHEYPHLVFCHGGPDDARHDPNAVPARAEHGKGVFVKISPQLREISDVKLRGIFRSRTRLCNLKRRARGRGSTGSRIFL